MNVVNLELYLNNTKKDKFQIISTYVNTAFLNYVFLTQQQGNIFYLHQNLSHITLWYLSANILSKLIFIAKITKITLMVKEEVNVFDKSIYSIFRRFEGYHTHYQGTVFRLKFPIFTNIAIFNKP